jgi:signal transduction histidine kinase
MILRRPTTIAYRVLVASAALAVVITLALTALVVAVSSLRSAIDEEARAKDTQAAILRLQTATGELESTLRGYLLTSNRRFQQPWQQALAALKPAERRVDRLVAGDAALHSRVELLQDEIRAYVSDYAEPLIALARVSPEIARSNTAADEGKRRTDLLRRRFTTLLASEDARTADRAAAVRRATSIATGAAIAALIVSGVLITGLGAIGARALSRRLRRAAGAASEIAGGEFSARLPEAGPAELAELGRAFNTMAIALDESRRTLLAQNRQLQENERRKTELITIVSHELRTPLAGLLGFTSLLLERDFDPQTRRRYVAIVHDESRRLSALVDRFLDVGRVEDDSFELQLEPVDLRQLLTEQTELMLADSTRHTLVLGFPDGPLDVMADRDRLAQVIGNLIGNAVKYSPDGGTVEVAVRHRGGDMLLVEVVDHGLGIAPEDQPQVFTKFFRGDAAARGIPGTGLGLAVAREIVEAHGGRIGFESQPGAGSTFWIELARAPATAAGKPATAA